MNLTEILSKTFGIKPGERVLIVTDEKKLAVAEKFYDSARNLSDRVELAVKPVGNFHGEEPPEEIAEKMKDSDVVIAVTTHSLTHTRARKEACENGARIATMPCFQETMFGALVEPERIRKTASVLLPFLRPGNHVRVTTDSGTDITFTVGPKVLVDDGDYTVKGSFGNLPAGEVFFFPVRTNGKIVIDLMRQGEAEYAPPGTEIAVREGRVISVSTECRLSRILETVENSEFVAEFGLGLNPKAGVIGNILQDEKSLGTCHFAFGDSGSIGGPVECDVHLDAILFNPTVKAGKKFVMKKGRLSART